MDGSVSLHTYFGKIYNAHEDIVLRLDHDDMHGYGDETITLEQQEATPCISTFYVHNYSQEVNFVGSGGVAVLNCGRGGQIVRLAVPQQPVPNGFIWELFTIDENLTVKVINKIKAAGARAQNTVSSSTQQRPNISPTTAGPLEEKVYLTPSVFDIHDFCINLKWGAQPRDLDLHALIKIGKTELHTYFANKENKSGSTVVTLDHDDLSGNGNETITVFQDPEHLANMKFYVQNYSEQPDMQESDASVTISSGGGGHLCTLNIPKHFVEDGLIWELFVIEKPRCEKKHSNPMCVFCICTRLVNLY